MRKRSLIEMEYQLSALRWRLRARYNGLVLDLISWGTLTWWLGAGWEIPIAGGVAGATGGVILINCLIKYMGERAEYISKVTEFNDMVERGNNA